MSFLRRNVSTLGQLGIPKVERRLKLDQLILNFRGPRFYGDSIVSIVKRCKEICMVQLVLNGFDMFGSTVQAFATRNGLQRATHKWLPAGHFLGLLKLLRQN